MLVPKLLQASLQQAADMLRGDAEKLSGADIAILVLDGNEHVVQVVFGRVLKVTGTDPDQEVVITLEPVDALPEGLGSIREQYGARHATDENGRRVYVFVSSGNVEIDDVIPSLCRSLFPDVQILDLRPQRAV